MSPAQRLGRLAKARALLETVEFADGGEDWSLLANATTALDMLIERNMPQQKDPA